VVGEIKLERERERERYPLPLLLKLNLYGVISFTLQKIESSHFITALVLVVPLVPIPSNEESHFRRPLDSLIYCELRLLTKYISCNSLSAPAALLGISSPLPTHCHTLHSCSASSFDSQSLLRHLNSIKKR